jgi:hypothetical protein
MMIHHGFDPYKKDRDRRFHEVHQEAAEFRKAHQWTLQPSRQERTFNAAKASVTRRASKVTLPSFSIQKD